MRKFAPYFFGFVLGYFICSIIPSGSSIINLPEIAGGLVYDRVAENSFNIQVADLDRLVIEREVEVERIREIRVPHEEVVEESAEIYGEFLAETADLFDHRPVTDYVNALLDQNSLLRDELSAQENVVEVLRKQNDLLRERVAFLSKPKMRHGPGFGFGITPAGGFALTLGWTVSWS